MTGALYKVENTYIPHKGGGKGLQAKECQRLLGATWS